MDKTKRIAIALEIDQPYPHHQRIFSGIQQYARQKPDWQCHIDEHPMLSPSRRGRHYGRYDGVIARASHRMQQRLARLGIPLVNTHYQTARAGLACICYDPHQMGRIAAEHLMERGFRRLNVLFDRSHTHAKEISNAFEQRAAEENIRCNVVEVPDLPYIDADSWIKLEKQIVGLLENLTPPTGMFIEATPVGRLLIELSQSFGFHVPQDIAVLCHQNLEAVGNVAPQISSIAANEERVGYEAAQLLDQLMAGGPVPDRPILVPPSGINARESTDYFAVKDELVANALRYISMHLRDRLRVDEIAFELAISPRLLQKRFAEVIGRGVSEEIRRLRLETAKRMLAEPGRPINTIPKEAGLGSTNVMNKLFQRELGTTPSDYRKQLLGERGAATGKA